MSESDLQTTSTARARQVRQWLRRVTAMMWLRRALIFSAAWLLIWGVAALAVRVGLDRHGPVLLWGAVGLGAAWALALVSVRRRRPSPATVRALIDRHNRAGGLVTAEGEQSIGGWEQRLGTLTLPVVRWRGGRCWLLSGAAMVFLLATLLAPTRFTGPQHQPPLHVSNQVASLDRQIETLEQEKLLEEQQARQMRDKLNQVQKDARGREPAKTWESLDHLRQQIDQNAKQTAAEARTQSRRLSETKALAQSLDQAGSQLNQQVKQAAMTELRSRLDQAAAAQKQLGGLNAKNLSRLGKQLGHKAGRGASLSKKQLAELAKAAGQSRGELMKKLRKLRKARLIDAKTLRQCKAGKTSGKKLARALKRLSKSGKPGNGKAIGRCLVACRGGGNKPGRGGITRGRGDAKMTWNAEASSDQGTKFEAKRLPRGAMPAPEQSRRLGLSRGTPQTHDEAGPSAGGGLAASAAGEGGASDHRVLPKHRGAVKRYFDRGDAQATE